MMRAMAALEVPHELRLVAAVWVGMVGGAVGSFLNVLIARVPAGQSVVWPGSRCPRCDGAIAWYDNVPLISFLVLRARCRACGAPISWRYPLVEALGVVAALAAYSRHQLSLSALVELALVSLLLALSFIDLDHWLLPYRLTLPLLGIGLAGGLLRVGAAPSFASSALGAVIGGGAFWLVAAVGERVLRKEALGMGDVWLLAGIGAWLGARAIVPVVLLASTQGAVVGLVQLLLGRGQPGPQPGTEPSPPPAVIDAGVGAPEEQLSTDAPGAPSPAEAEEVWIPPRHAIPFGPFLALGALEWLYLARVLARVVPPLGPFL
jgi:leader peptidase (prepilin peptidase)/N-methyltransferase